ncbi:helix-turn-helix transcriptional regulator [Streptomyces physcomitrii]|uniref:Winged helix-turn-helix transcriptional regulator n=1 Tax=Streptomyces physcomitrii TaxID=2724184 RepID=A0ABX1H924_9ACTN|nr:helix-turn-helix transcriptional regulator [Streptomyces physcomitrii]NKI44553.1 winged helix-turn-helix transcriptional regulator [Streptomyces physcomitrii]
MLSAIGLDEVHESAYRALVSAGAAEVPELARRLMLGEYATERALRRLERHGLAARSTARPERWVAAPPGAALGALLAERRGALDLAAQAAAQLAEEYHSRSGGPAGPDLVEVVSGTAAVARRFTQAVLGAREELCVLLPGSAAGRPGAEPRPGRAPRRTVVERSALAPPRGVPELGAAREPGEALRVVDRVPAHLVVADRSLALVALDAGAAEPSAVVVHASALLDALLLLFESVWSRAVPLRLGPRTGPVAPEPETAEPDETDLEILSLLLAGLTDASVAKQLDLGLRTVQRRVRRLMELTGVTTRLQLGWHAYERDWIAREARRPLSPSGS